MNPVFSMLLIVIALLLLQEARRKSMVGGYMQMKKRGENPIMTEAVKAFIGRECIIYLLSGSVTGTVQEVHDRSVLVKTASDQELINLDFVIRIREYPRKKNGKKKSVIPD